MWKNGAGVMMESATVSAVVFPSIGASMILRRVIGKEHPAPASAVLNKHFRHPASASAFPWRCGSAFPAQHRASFREAYGIEVPIGLGFKRR